MMKDICAFMWFLISCFIFGMLFAATFASGAHIHINGISYTIKLGPKR